MFGRYQKTRIFVATICFWKMVLFLVPIQSHQTLQKSGFQQAQGKTQNGTFGCKKYHFGEGDLPKIRSCLPKCKKVFFWSVFLFLGGFVFFSSVFLCLCFAKRPKKVIFLQFSSFFSNFVPPKGLSLESLFSSYSVFFFGFPF